MANPVNLGGCKVTFVQSDTPNKITASFKGISGQNEEATLCEFEWQPGFVTYGYCTDAQLADVAAAMVKDWILRNIKYVAPE